MRSLAVDRHCPLFIVLHFKICQTARAQRANEIQIPRIPSALPLPPNEICHSHSRPQPTLPPPNHRIQCVTEALSEVVEAKKYALGDSYFLRDQRDFTVPCKGLYLTAEIAQSEEANGVDRGSGQTNMWGERKRITRLEG